MIVTAPLRTLLAVSHTAVGFPPSALAFSVRNLSVAHVDSTFRPASGRVAADDAELVHASTPAAACCTRISDRGVAGAASIRPRSV